MGLPLRLGRGVLRRAKWRRVARWALWGGGSVLVLVVSLIGAVLYLPPVSSGIARWGVSIYDGMIPGSMTVARIEGALGRDLVLHEVEIQDRHGHRLVAAGRIRVGCRIAPLLRGIVDVGTLEIDGGRVVLPAADDTGWADLAPPSEPAPPPVDDGSSFLDFELPVTAIAALWVTDFELSSRDSDDEVRVHLAARTLRLSARGAQAEARADLEASASVPGLDLDVHQLALGVAWDHAKVALDRFEVDTDWGSIGLPPSSVDLRSGAASLGTLAVRADPDVLERFTGIAPTSPLHLSLSGGGSLRDLQARLALAADGLGALTLHVEGRLAPTPDLRAKMGARVELKSLVGGLRRDAVDLRLEASAAVPSDAPAQIRVELQCTDCDPGGPPPTVRAEATLEPGWRHGTATVNVRAARASVDVSAELVEDEAFSADVRVHAPDLARAGNLASRFVDVPPLAGALRTRVECRGTAKPFAADCSTSVDLQDGTPVQRVALQASAHVEPDRQSLLARTLEVEAQGLHARLTTPRARVEHRAGRIDVHGLDLLVTTPTGRASLSLEGRLGGADRPELRARLQRIELAAVNAVVPDLRLGGIVAGAVTARGSLARPEIHGTITAEGLALQGRHLGELEVGIDYAEAVGAVRLSHRSALGRIDVTADVPIDLGALERLDPRKLTPRLDLVARRLTLAGLGELVPEAPPMSGEVDFELELDGSLSRPRIDAALSGRELALDGRALGSLRLKAEYRDRSAAVDLSVHHQRIALVELQAEAPLDLDLARGAASWHADRPHDLSLTVSDVDLALLRAWVPDLDLQGRASVDAELRGPATAPVARVELSADALALLGRELGSLRTELSFTDHRLDFHGWASGPAVEEVDLFASVPVAFDGAPSSATWDRRGEHNVEVSLRGIDLHEVLAWAPRPIAAGGSANIWLQLDGRAPAPEIRADVDGTELHYGGRPVGDLRVLADYADDRLHAGVQLTRQTRPMVDLDATVPVSLELGRGVDWHRDGRHELRVRLPEIGRPLLAPWVELPEDLDLEFVLDARASGSLADFDLHTTLDGTFGVPKVDPFRLALRTEATQAAQSATVRLSQRDQPVLAVDASARAPVPALVSGTASVHEIPIQARLASSDAADLALFEGLLEGILADPKGPLRLNVGLAGTLGTPELDGSLRIERGSTTIVPLRQRVDRVEVRVDFDEQRVELANASLRSGSGTIRADGRVVIDGGAARGGIDVTIDNFPLRQPGLPRMWVKSKIRGDLDRREGDTRVGVTLDDTEVLVSLGNVAAPKAIPQSERVHYVVLGDRTTPPDPGGTRAPPEPTPVAPPGRFEFDLAIASPLRITGPAVDMSWVGAIETVSDHGTTTAQGALQAKRGEFELFGNEFEIEQGIVSFPKTGDIVPYLDVIATSTVDDVVVTVLVRGRASAPRIEFSSEPSYTPQQILTILVTGSAELESADPAEVQGQAAALLAAFASPALQQELNQSLGVDKVSATFGDSPAQPILSVGKNLSKKVYAETRYHVNAPEDRNRAQIAVEYEFLPHWALETYFGDRKIGGADVFWRIRFTKARSRRDAEARGSATPR